MDVESLFAPGELAGTFARMAGCRPGQRHGRLADDLRPLCADKPTPTLTCAFQNPCDTP